LVIFYSLFEIIPERAYKPMDMHFLLKHFKFVKAVFWTLSIVHISIKLQRFGSWIFFRLQVKRKDRNPSCWAPWLSSDLEGLRLAQPGGPTARDSVLPLYLKTEEDPASET
jgi:hypothetical protein